jgi:hypothetical protein
LFCRPACNEKELLMKITLNTLKPRNPLVAASRRRLAGPHRSGTGAQRQQAKAGLRQEVARLRLSP